MVNIRYAIALGFISMWIKHISLESENISLLSFLADYNFLIGFDVVDPLELNIQRIMKARTKCLSN